MKTPTGYRRISLMLSCYVDLTRQYKMMQSELGLRIHILEQTVTTLRSQLGMCMWFLIRRKHTIHFRLVYYDFFYIYACMSVRFITWGRLYESRLA